MESSKGFLRTSPQWLYDPIEPYKTQFLKVSEKHTLYVEESGNLNGQPVVFLHGGPGAGTSPDHRRFFNPKKYRIVLFDQRGCGKSTPHASLEENTTWDLVADIERIREHLKIDQWHVFGGSWGSTLALSYAITHPSKVSALILRGIFLTRRSELEWFYQAGAHWIFPDRWERYRDHIPESERGDFISAYYKRLTSSDEKVRLAAAKVWTTWETALSALIVDPKSIQDSERDEFALAFARIEAHYFYHRSFFESDDFLLKNAQKLKGIPMTIVQGRYDVVCPVQSAWELHHALPHSDLVIVPDAGHSAFDPGICRALVAATDRFA